MHNPSQQIALKSYLALGKLLDNKNPQYNQRVSGKPEIVQFLLETALVRLFLLSHKEHLLSPDHPKRRLSLSSQSCHHRRLLRHTLRGRSPACHLR